jgi:hypothetical protein
MVRALLLLAPLILLPAPPARAACLGVPTLPTDITAPGHYCLNKDFAQDFPYASALDIEVDDVVLDCQGHVIAATNATNTAAAIYAPGGRRNVTIRNCVVDGFYVGIFLSSGGAPGATANRIEDNEVRRARQVGIYVIGSHNRVERNRVVGHTANYNGVAYGVFMYSSGGLGVGNAIRDNVFADWKPDPPGSPNEVIAIYGSQLQNTEITGNVISGIYGSTGLGTYGIRLNESSGTVVARNTILTPPPLPAPLDGPHFGIYLPGTAEAQATNACRDNIVGTTTAITGCVESGNTEF